MAKNSRGVATKRQVGGTHYQRLAIQPGYFAHVNQLGPMETMVLRYICRHGNKNGRQDIEKAIHCLELLLEWEYNTQPKGERNAGK